MTPKTASAEESRTSSTDRVRKIGLQMQTDLAINPSGDVWVMDNWQDIASCFGTPNEALSTRCGGQGVAIFFGMAKPVRAPQIGPARQLQGN